MGRIFCSLILALSVCPIAAQAADESGPQELQYEKQLEGLRANLDHALALWEESIDDPVADDELKHSYEELQDLCRKLYKRDGGFGTLRQNQLCEITSYPHAMFYNEQVIRVNNLRKQLFEIDTPGTVANDYYRRPSESNLEKLRNIFEKVNKYYVGAPYTWNRYYNKFLFSRSRLQYARGAWEKRLAEYQDAAAAGGSPRRAEVARKRAEFAFERLKDETRTSNLSFACKVNAFYVARDLDEYLRKEKDWEEMARLRQEAGRKKEVVVFIHGLGEDRKHWKKFPLLLAFEDFLDKSSDRFFQVYVFRFDTIEDSKSVEGFVRELSGFLGDVLEQEEVDAVNLIGHSLGGVISLKYLVKYVDRQLGEGYLPTDAAARAEKLIEGYTDGSLRRPVARFIGIAPSLSGSEVANAAAAMFKKKPHFYERSLAPFQSGIPVAGDLQVLENQIGSRVNINSFTRLALERPLDPQRILEMLPEEKRRAYPEDVPAKLSSRGIRTLTIIGKPALVMLFVNKEEDDGLVKCYSANLNHIFMGDADAAEDIGYKGGAVRYVNKGHVQLIEVEDRNHPSYRYAVSFLQDDLIGQEDANAAHIRNFICLLRVYPEEVDIAQNPEFCFYDEPKVHFSQEERYALPSLRVNVIGGKDGSSNASVRHSSWNPYTGVHYLAGYQKNREKPSWLTLRLSAEGYETKTVHVPVHGGLVSYCVRVKLVQSKERATAS